MVADESLSSRGVVSEALESGVVTTYMPCACLYWSMVDRAAFLLSAPSGEVLSGGSMCLASRGLLPEWCASSCARMSSSFTGMGMHTDCEQSIIEP